MVKTVYAYQFDEIDFKDGEYIPLFIDYALFKNQKDVAYTNFSPLSIVVSLSFLNTMCLQTG